VNPSRSSLGKKQTKADIEVFILDKVFAQLPTPPFSVEEKQLVAKNVYAHVCQQAVRGDFSAVVQGWSSRDI
jgi:type I restriction enzyme, R subunit